MSCPSAGAGNGDISVVIVDPQGHKDTVELILENRGDAVFRCTYRPVMEGPHSIHVLFAGQEIPKSPFTVNIAEGEPPVPWTRRPSAWGPLVRPFLRPSRSADSVSFPEMEDEHQVMAAHRNPSLSVVSSATCCSSHGSSTADSAQVSACPPRSKGWKGASAPETCPSKLV